MSISLTPIQEKINTTWTTGASYTLTLNSTPTAGNVLIAYANCITSGGTVSSISQTNVSWTLVVRSTTTATRVVEWWIGIVSASPGTVATFHLSFTPAAANVSASMSEWSGINRSDPVVTSGGTGATSTNPNTGTMSPTAGINALIVGSIRGSNVPSPTPGAPFADLLSSDSGSRGFGTYQVVASTTGTYTATWTAASGLWGSAYAVFRGANGNFFEFM